MIREILYPLAKITGAPRRLLRLKFNGVRFNRFLLLILVIGGAGFLAPARAQNTISVSAANIQAGGSPLPSGFLCFQATANNGNPITFQLGGSGGQVINQPYCALIVNGATSLTIANPATTSPENIAYYVTVSSRRPGVGPGQSVLIQSPLVNVCAQSGTCTAPYTFNYDLCISSGACASTPLPVPFVPVGGPTGAPGPTGAAGGAFSAPNAGSTGTAVNKLAKVTGAPSTVVITSTSDASGAVGVVISGAGTSGDAVVQTTGLVSCVFDGATTAGDYVQISSSTAGDCTDAGSTYPTSGQVIGRVLSTNGSGGTYAIDLFSAEIIPAAGGLSGMTGGQVGIAGSATTITGSKAIQGTDSKILSVGTVSGSGSSLCTDSNGGATTTGCSGGSAASVNGQSCGTCNVNSGDTSGTIAINKGNGNAIGGIDLPDVKIIPAAACPGGSPGAGWSSAVSNFSPVCRAGTNNLGAAMQEIPSTGGAAQFMVELPSDWDSSNQPYLKIFYGSGSNTSGTVIWTVSSACSKEDGSVTDDPTLNAESAMSTQTMAAANRTWAQSAQLTQVTSGNGCVAGGSVILQVAVSGTASSAINAYQAVVTIPRLPAVQAN